jgi:hypothetical protein
MAGGGIMETRRTEEIRAELAELLSKQREVLESRMLGTASESELLEYELRQEIVDQLCKTLSRPEAA